MTADLQELFDRAGRHAPEPVLNADSLLIRARRARARRRATSLAVAGGVTLVAAGAIAWVGALGHDAAPVGPPVSGSPAPQTSTPTPTASASPSTVAAELRQPGPIMVASPSSDTNTSCAMRAVIPETGASSRVNLPSTLPCGGGSGYAWSPDGTRLAGLVRSADGVTSQLVLWTPGDAHDRLLGRCARCPGVAPTWSSDGRSVSVVEQDPGQVVRYDVATGARSTTSLSFGAGESPAFFALRPDGSQAVVAVGYCPSGASCPSGDGSAALAWRIDLVTMATGARQTLVPAAGLGRLPAALAWSPDGTRVAYVELHFHPKVGEAQVRLRWIDMFGGQVRTLHDSGASCYCIGAGPSLAWAPDGSSLAVSMPDGKLDAAWSVYVVGTDGSDWTRVPGTDSAVVMGWNPAT
jgi:WD40 repeat protein